MLQEKGQYLHMSSEKWASAVHEELCRLHGDGGELPLRLLVQDPALLTILCIVQRSRTLGSGAKCYSLNIVCPLQKIHVDI